MKVLAAGVASSAWLLDYFESYAREPLRSISFKSNFGSFLSSVYLTSDCLSAFDSISLRKSPPLIIP